MGGGKTLGKLLITLRGSRSRASVAAALGCHPATCWRWECDHTRPRDLLTVMRAYGATPAQIHHALWLAAA